MSNIVRPEPLNVIYALHLGDENYRYVGLTGFGADRRLRGHLNGGTSGSQYPVHKWIRKHKALGEEIVITVLETCQHHSELADRERYWIAYLGTFVGDAGSGLNMTRGGEGMWGHRWTDEQRAAHSIAHIGLPSVPKTQVTKDLLSVIGKKKWADPEYAAMMTAALTGRTFGTAGRANIAAAVRRNYARLSEDEKVAFAARAASGGHVRWHVKRGIVKSECEFCQ